MKTKVEEMLETMRQIREEEKKLYGLSVTAEEMDILINGLELRERKDMQELGKRFLNPAE